MMECDGCFTESSLLSDSDPFGIFAICETAQQLASILNIFKHKEAAIARLRIPLSILGPQLFLFTFFTDLQIALASLCFDTCIE
jgi:hypothetical protein